jgi:hypothetical protein
MKTCQTCPNDLVCHDLGECKRPVCENCGDGATYRAVHWEAGGCFACEDCMKTHSRDYTQTRKIWPQSRS